MPGKSAAGAEAFDPRRAVRFDVPAGSASDARGARLLLVPSSAIEALPSAVLVGIGGEIGRACGARAAASFGGGEGVREASLEAVVSHLAGELAVTGAFVLHLERWGRAMVAVVENPSVDKTEFVAAVLRGALTAATGKDVAAAFLGVADGRSRYFLGSVATAERVTELAQRGTSYASILAELQGSAS